MFLRSQSYDFDVIAHTGALLLKLHGQFLRNLKFSLKGRSFLTPNKYRETLIHFKKYLVLA